MKLFKLLCAVDKDLAVDRCKIHLACWNGREDPLDTYLAGGFPEWQQEQTRKNFERDFVLSLIALPKKDTWLFAGVYNAKGCCWAEKLQCFQYSLEQRLLSSEYDGRLVVSFRRPGRQSYLCAERWHASLDVAEIRPEKMRVSEFPGYKAAMLTKQQLDIVVQQGIDSWKAALRSVGGVYVIADKCSGKLYVGSATGDDGIWCRWCAYSMTGHGGNRDLRALLETEGSGYASNFQFGVLEIADTHTSKDVVVSREAYWKNLLLTRAPNGLNGN